MWRIKRSPRLAAALLALLLFMLPPARAEEGGAAPDAHAQRRFVIELWQLVNAARDAASVPPLTLDLALSAPAQMRAAECLFADMRAQETAHLRPDGRAFYTALEEAGFSDWRNARENLAYSSDLTLSAGRAFQSWMASDSGHREAMLDPAVTTMGAGAFRAAAGTAVAGKLYPDGCMFLCLLLTDGTPKEPYIPQGSFDDGSGLTLLLRRPALPTRRGRGLYPSTR